MLHELGTEIGHFLGGPQISQKLSSFSVWAWFRSARLGLAWLGLLIPALLKLCSAQLSSSCGLVPWCVFPWHGPGTYSCWRGTMHTWVLSVLSPYLLFCPMKAIIFTEIQSIAWHRRNQAHHITATGQRVGIVCVFQYKPCNMFLEYICVYIYIYLYGCFMCSHLYK